MHLFKFFCTNTVNIINLLDMNFNTVITYMKNGNSQKKTQNSLKYPYFVAKLKTVFLNIPTVLSIIQITN